MHSLHVHHRLVQAFDDLRLPVSRPQRANLALLCQALAFSPSCQLATLALAMPLDQPRRALIQRLRRLLKADQLHPSTCYHPVRRQLLTHWAGREISLVMDRTDIENRFSVLSLGVAYRKRLLPLAWDVLTYGSTDQDRQVALLHRIQPDLPCDPHIQVHFYADAEFRAVKLQRTCRSFGWHWQVGLKGDTLYNQPGVGYWQSLAELKLQLGQRRYLQGVYLTQEHVFVPVNLIANWAERQDYPRYFSLDLPADKHAWRRGRKRFWIEPTFRDWKSCGFDLEHSQLDDPGRLNVLVLGVALTTLWMIYVGEWLIRSGRRDELAVLSRADYSLFRLGRDYLQRCRTLERAVPIGFKVQHVG